MAVDLVMCGEDSLPEFYKSGRGTTTHILCTLTPNLDLVPGHLWRWHTNSRGVQYQRLSFNLAMCIESGGLRFELRVGDKGYGNVVASFN